MGGAPGIAPPPSTITTGTGPVAFFGVLKVAWRSTLIDGSAELSTCPMSCFVTTGTLPNVSSMVLNTRHVTFGNTFGRRPYTSRSNSSMISARRALHCAGVVTFEPLFITSGSGSVGYGVAFASS